MSTPNDLKEFRHDVKNDLSVIIAFAQLLKLKTSDEKSLEQLQTIEQRSHKIIGTIEKHLTKKSN